jgi:hypothetical protein
MSINDWKEAVCEASEAYDYFEDISPIKRIHE